MIQDEIQNQFFADIAEVAHVVGLLQHIAQGEHFVECLAEL